MDTKSDSSQGLEDSANTPQTPQEKKSYNPAAIESEIYKICESRGYFEVNRNKEKNFCIMMPPPNVTGVLHIGHALTLSLQDIIARYKRMDGYATLYQPGMDHAGIATQNIVEKQLLTQGISKQELDREKFIQKVWEWKEESGGKILQQMRTLGISPAWSRLRFTMDEGLQNAVKKAFVEWFSQGLIVQDSYMINWCSHDGALSDIEVEYEENEGSLYYLKYPIAQSNGEYIVVATTRPETFFGDTAVMVNPHDERYKHLVGKSVLLPLSEREIPIIADSSVDMEFGTGCVKVTPAHDSNDYEVAKKHNLPFLVVFDEKGILNSLAGEFKGLERLESRDAIIAKLQNLGFVEKIESYTHQVGKCYRCGNIIEPYISKQWFVKKEVALNAIKSVNDGEVKFFPSTWLNNYNAWMNDLRDWCISRQLWWGHRIPVWYCECGEKVASEHDYPTCPKCSRVIKTQDPDVLDTWFSSGLWAFSTLGWGNGTDTQTNLYEADDLQRFYPNSLLITGFDILFFWVARMLLSGESLLKKLPFRHIYLHALVRDEFGNKMSKSRGNVIDPLEIIKNYGADCLRYCLASLCVQGRDIKLSYSQLDLSKNFANKIYNAAQFLLLYAKQLRADSPYFADLSDFTHPLGIYLNARLHLTTQQLRNALDSYRFNEACNVLEHFLWDEFCDWGIEFAKAKKEAIFELGAIFKQALKLLHPFMPFLSDSLWHMLNGSSIETDDSIMIAEFPIVSRECLQTEDLQAEFERIKDAITTLRRIKATLEIGNTPIACAYVVLDRKVDYALMRDFVCKLARVQEIKLVDSKPENIRSVGDVGQWCECFVQLDGIDLDGIIARLKGLEAKLSKEIEKLSMQLENPNFLKNAPANILEQTRSALQNAKTKKNKVSSQLDTLRA
ncbi:valine--tRNA ligase [Helicobacter sp. 10-6591]|uniref:valine--tRNA ligase n=1 Tax=Helicobacter sp. 10-6591 TaxID=2004998 RepID=UPI000DCE10CD|nr:valine--tRNA ligase [Helicobacter sp. 10-6591]RAX55628.1 valine--tRNA ligase [Helicobacter sp. 10-6591]